MKWAFSLIALAGVVLTGCSHYTLGTTPSLGFNSLYIAPIENATSLPQSVAVISTALREAFLRDGRVVIVNSPDDADAILSVNLNRYSRDVASVLADDTGLARKFDLTLNATATLTARKGEKTLFKDRPLVVKRQIFTDDPRPNGQFANQLQAEYMAVPLLAEQLSAAAVHAVLDVW